MHITYVGNYGIFGEVKTPIFDFDIWNLHNSVLKGLPRTNNSVEAWHRSINSTLAVPHPNMALFLNLIANEEESTRANIIQRKNGCLSFGSVNTGYEYKLKAICDSYMMYEVEEYCKILNVVVHWHTD